MSTSSDSDRKRGTAGWHKAKPKLDALLAQRIEASHQRYLSAAKSCPTCETLIPYEKRHTHTYCNHSCAATYSNKQRQRKQSRPCLHCRKDFKARGETKYCGSACFQAHRKELSQKRLLEGHDAGLSQQALRRRLIEMHGAACMECGWNKVNPTSRSCPVELEHIDGNSTNNVLPNLKLLCPNCHSLSPTYKGLNRGKGRSIRRERYRAGKSY